jgi:hypothetical protein
MPRKYNYFIIIVLLIGFSIQAQNGTVNIKKIDTLLRVKKEMLKDHKIKSFYTIQLFSGKKENAIIKRDEFSNNYPYDVTIEYETPNYKVWVGRFRTKLEADKIFNIIRKDYPNALIFMPGR